MLPLVGGLFWCLRTRWPPIVRLIERIDAEVAPLFRGIGPLGLAMTSPSLRSYLSPLPLIAVLRGILPPEIPSIAGALTDHGFRILEVPLNSPDPFESIRLLSELLGDRCLTGAGTVLKVADVARVAEAGGRLIVMPHGR